MNKDIEKEVLDLLKQEIDTKTYLVKYSINKQNENVISRKWAAISVEDNVNLATMYKIDSANNYIVSGKRSIYNLTIMGEIVFSMDISSDDVEKQDVKDAKLPENVRAAFDLLKQAADLKYARANAHAYLMNRVAARNNAKGK